MLTTRGPINATFDDSPEDGSKGVVFGFVGGDPARDFATLSQRTRAAPRCIAELVDAFGPEAAQPAQYIESMWKNET